MVIILLISSTFLILSLLNTLYKNICYIQFMDESIQNVDLIL